MSTVRIDAMRTVTSASMTTSYQTLGTAFNHAMRLVHFINGTNGDVVVSFDGNINNIPVLANSFVLYDTTTNEDENEAFRWAANTQAYVKWLNGAPGIPTGSFYLATMYAQGE